jgi:hypothetical protein
LLGPRDLREIGVRVLKGRPIRVERRRVVLGAAQAAFSGSEISAQARRFAQGGGVMAEVIHDGHAPATHTTSLS